MKPNMKTKSRKTKLSASSMIQNDVTPDEIKDYINRVKDINTKALPSGYEVQYPNEEDKKNYVIRESETDNFYVNVCMNFETISAGVTGSTGPTYNPNVNNQAVSNVTYTRPIISKCSDYYCSVIRFDIPLQYTPLYIFPVIPNTYPSLGLTGGNLSPLIVGIRYNNSGTNNYFSQNLVYVSDFDPPRFPIPIQNQQTQVVTPYYYVFSYQNLIDSTNTALKLACQAFLAAFPGAPQAASIAAGDYPYFFLNPSTQLITFVVNKVWVSANNGFIYMNALESDYFAGFPNELYVNYGSVNNDDVELEVENTPYTQFYGPNDPTSYQGNGITGITGYTYNALSNHLGFTQEYPSIVSWLSLRKILIVSGTIPVVNEFIPNVGLQTGVATSLPVLSDFVPSFNNSGDGRSIAYYIPTSQYRLIDMIQDNPLQTLDIRVYWQDTNNNIYPLYVPTNQQANIKLAFINKNLYKSDRKNMLMK